MGGKSIGGRLRWLAWWLVAGMSAAGAGMARLAPGPARADPPAAGVPQALAQDRAARVRQLRVDLALAIPAQRDRPITGSAVMRFGLADATRPLWIDFDAPGAADAVIVANGRRVATRAVNGHLRLPPAALRRGANRVQVSFTAGDAPLNRGDDLLYTLFVPARARQALPCFDQPDLKARWTLTLEHPAAWRSVANGAERSRRVQGDRVRVRFAQTRPLPTYLLAFVAGAMQVDVAVRQGRPMRMFHRETDAVRLARNRDALFDLHAQSLAALEAYTGIPYPFGKFDFVLVPAFAFGGMEHPGAIAYRAESLLLDESATPQRRLDRARVIAHETAHMWFGDLVTMRWFDDVWTKEVFANFVAAKVMDPLFPGLRHDLQFFLAHHGGAYAVDRSAGTHAIRQPLDNLDGAGSLYGPIIYEKSPVLMRQLEERVGEAAFRAGVRDHLRRHAFGSATWDEWVAALSRHTRQDLRHWSAMWVDEAGRPAIVVEPLDEPGRPPRLQVRQHDAQGRGRVWPQRLHLALVCGATVQRVDLELDGPQAELPTDATRCRPDAVLAGGGGWGYGEMVLDPRSQAWLAARARELPDPLDRAVAWSALWEALLGARLAPDAAYDALLALLEREPEPQLAEDLLDDLGTLWWRFLTPAQRAGRAAPLEVLLRDRLAAAAGAGGKAAWFQALVRIATTPATTAWLADLWRREARIDGMPLSERDETTLAWALALREVPGVEALLDAQRQRITDPDRGARFDFVRGAAQADPEARARWFRALRRPEARQHEVWVLEGLALLHHPL